MFKKQELTRLGDILVRKGLISAAQLDIAIQEQARRKKLLTAADPQAQVTPIGEILIELGFIDRSQLKRGLNWQQRLRRASIAMALCAPFMVFAPSASASVVRTPLTIEAENFSAMQGITVEATTDVGGGKSLGYIDKGDWMSYNNIVIPVTGAYKITYRVSSSAGGGILSLQASSGTVLGVTSIPKTGSAQTWTEVTQIVNLNYGVNNLKIVADAGGFNINWMKIENIDVAPVSFLIEAENYSTMKGIVVETTTDIGGGKSIGYFDTGDWLRYENTNLLIPATGTYKLTYRAAAANEGAVLEFRNAVDGTVLDTAVIPKTGGWQTWTDVVRQVNLPQGLSKVEIFAKTGGVNLNSFKVESTDIAQITGVESAAGSSAAAQEAPLFPLTIQAELYSTMKGVVNEPTTDVGGGKSVGYIDTGDWLAFANHKFTAPFTGKYKIQYRVASASSTGVFSIVNTTTGTTLDTVAVPKTGGWQTWTTVEKEISLTEGEHVLELRAQSSGFNINWLKLEPLSSPMPLTIAGSSYSEMSGVKTETSLDVGGGSNIAYIDTGDWMDFKNTEVFIPVTGKYKVTYRVAAVSSSARFSLNEAGTATVFDTVSVPATGGWQKWVNVEKIVTIPAGRHLFGMKILSGGFNFNWFKFEPVDDNGNVISSSSSSSSTSSIQSSSSSSSSVISSSSSSSAPSVTSSSATSTVASSSSTPAVVSSSSASSQASSSAAPSYHLGGAIGISWTPPAVRENGKYLDITELGGYEIRYKKTTDVKFTYISVTDPWTTRYDFDSLPEGDYIFQIAAFDANGIYSPFVNIQ